MRSLMISLLVSVIAVAQGPPVPVSPKLALPIQLGSTSEEVQRILGQPTERYGADPFRKNPAKGGKVIEWYYHSGIVGVFDEDRLMEITLNTYAENPGFRVYAGAIFNDVKLSDNRQTILQKLGKPTKLEHDEIEPGTDPEVPVVWPKVSRYYWQFEGYVLEADFLDQAQSVSKKVTFPKDRLEQVRLMNPSEFAQSEFAKQPVKFVPVIDAPAKFYVHEGFVHAAGFWVPVEGSSGPAGPSVSDIECDRDRGTCHERLANIVPLSELGGQFMLQADSADYRVTRWNAHEIVAENDNAQAPAVAGSCHLLGVLKVDLVTNKIVAYQTLKEPVDSDQPDLAKKLCHAANNVTWELRDESPFSIAPDNSRRQQTRAIETAR